MHYKMCMSKALIETVSTAELAFEWKLNLPIALQVFSPKTDKGKTTIW